MILCNYSGECGLFVFPHCIFTVAIYFYRKYYFYLLLLHFVVVVLLKSEHSSEHQTPSSLLLPFHYTHICISLYMNVNLYIKICVPAKQIYGGPALITFLEVGVDRVRYNCLRQEQQFCNCNRVLLPEPLPLRWLVKDAETNKSAQEMILCGGRGWLGGQGCC